MEVLFDRKFLKEFARLQTATQQEARETLAIFTVNQFDSRLKRHKLTGVLKNFWSIRVNFKIRILFFVCQNGDIIFRRIGDHSLYEKFRL